MLHDLALDHVDLGRHGIELDLQTRGRFIDKIDRFIRQKTVADVAMRKHRRGHERRVCDAHAVMHFVALLQPAQNRDRIFHARLFHQHRLETPLERSVFLDVLAIFIERRRADRAQLAARQHRLKHVRRIDGTFRRASADNCVQLVDEQNDLPLRIGHFFQERFQTILKFAAELRARDHRPDVHRDDPFVLERIGHVAADDAPRQAFHDCSFADARIADQHRIIFRPAREHLHDAPDFVVASDYRINLSAPRQLGQVAPIFFQCLIFSFRILIGHALRTAHLL